MTSKIYRRPPCLLHAILSCPIIDIYQIIPAIKWSYKNSKIWVRLTWGYIAKGPTKTGQSATFFGQHGDHLTWGYIAKGPTKTGQSATFFCQNGDHLKWIYDQKVIKNKVCQKVSD